MSSSKMSQLGQPRRGKRLERRTLRRRSPGLVYILGVGREVGGALEGETATLSEIGFLGLPVAGGNVRADESEGAVVMRCGGRTGRRWD